MAKQLACWARPLNSCRRVSTVQASSWVVPTREHSPSSSSPRSASTGSLHAKDRAAASAVGAAGELTYEDPLARRGLGCARSPAAARNGAGDRMAQYDLPVRTHRG